VDAGAIAREVLARGSAEANAVRGDAVAAAVRGARIKALRTWKEGEAARRRGIPDR
jgi:hypothetical protein